MKTAKPEQHSAAAAEIFAPIGATLPEFFISQESRARMVTAEAYTVSCSEKKGNLFEVITPITAVFISGLTSKHPFIFTGIN